MVVLSELSEESLPPSLTQGRGYDVFLSFRGADTRLSFTGHLYMALIHANITTFFDEEEIETGEDLKPELESAIEASRASVIVLSENYATSTWCLDELVLILEQRKTSNHIVFPIFYHVEPTDVRKQLKAFRDAMAKHTRRMEAETDANKRSKLAQKMERWNKALTEVADLKGKDVKDRSEIALIEGIVRDIDRRLRISSKFPPPQLIGRDNSIKFVTSWLNDASSNTTDILTIVGLGGIGKTSLAKYVYALHFHEFDTSTFIEDINRRCVEKSNGLLDVQRELCADISKPSSIQVRYVSIYTSMIEKAVVGKRVFLVLDDIDSLDQLDALLGSKGFHWGSKIIITTKNRSLTQSCALFKMNLKPKHVKHELKGVSEVESQKILCFHAFTCDDPNAGYEEVTKMLVKYCEGHPLALKVLGRSLHDREVLYWEGYIDRLKKDNDSPINDVLKLSFESLPSRNDKDLFKHIACFFVGMDRDVIVTILEACDIETKTGITNLVDRCLLGIGWNDKFEMHQLVQEMGRFVVREESPDKPWERSRLWGHESFIVLKQKKGSENVSGLTLDMRMLEEKKIPGSLELKTDALSKMDRLMLLQLNYVQIRGSYENFPEELRWLCMHGFPLKSIPLDLRIENLVALDMSYSNIESFGFSYSYPQRLHKRLKQLIGSCSKDKRLLGSLKILNLSFCEQLRSLGGFDYFPKLEMLILKGCIGLLEVCESIEKCCELVLIDMSYCKKLEKLPRNLGKLKKVKTLLLNGYSFGESQIKVRNRKLSETLKANNIGISTIISSSTVLQAMPSYSKFSVISLPRSLVRLSLENNNLSTESFPMELSSLTMLKELYLDKNPIVSVPSFVFSLPRIETLSMRDCKMLTTIKRLPHTLRHLDLRSYFYDPFKHQRTCNKIQPMAGVNPLLRKLEISLGSREFPDSSFEFEGRVKIQGMAGVEQKVLHCLGWSNLNFLNGRDTKTSFDYRESKESEIQMYYEFGIFSTIYEGEEMPNWIMDRSTGPIISFNIPSSLNKLTGLNFCCVLTSQIPNEWIGLVDLPLIIFINETKNLTWIYRHYLETFQVDGNCLTLLSHWMFGMNEMECGDHVTVTMRHETHFTISHLVAKECGVSFVYDDGKEEEDVLGYYKSWNHIIGGDLTGFQTTTGEYILNKDRFQWDGLNINLGKYSQICGEGVHYKDERVHFKALALRKSGLLEDGS